LVLYVLGNIVVIKNYYSLATRIILKILNKTEILFSEKNERILFDQKKL